MITEIFRVLLPEPAGHIDVVRLLAVNYDQLPKLDSNIQQKAQSGGPLIRQHVFDRFATSGRGTDFEPRLEQQWHQHLHVGFQLASFVDLVGQRQFAFTDGLTEQAGQLTGLVQTMANQGEVQLFSVVEDVVDGLSNSRYVDRFSGKA